MQFGKVLGLTPGPYSWALLLGLSPGLYSWALLLGSHQRRLSPKIDQNQKSLRNFNMNGAKNHRKSEKLLSFSGRPEHVGSMLAACWQHVGEHVSSRNEHVSLIFKEKTDQSTLFLKNYPNMLVP